MRWVATVPRQPVDQQGAPTSDTPCCSPWREPGAQHKGQYLPKPMAGGPGSFYPPSMQVHNDITYITSCDQIAARLSLSEEVAASTATRIPQAQVPVGGTARTASRRVVPGTSSTRGLLSNKGVPDLPAGATRLQEGYSGFRRPSSNHQSLLVSATD